jgi:hypothetical protein
MGKSQVPVGQTGNLEGELISGVIAAIKRADHLEIAVVANINASIP